MPLDTQMTLALLQELLMALRANDADYYTKAMNLDPNSTVYKQALSGRGSAKVQAGRLSAGCRDYKRAALMEEYLAIEWLSSANGAYCK